VGICGAGADSVGVACEADGIMATAIVDDESAGKKLSMCPCYRGEEVSVDDHAFGATRATPETRIGCTGCHVRVV